MSFTFKWPRFSEQFHTNATQMLESALNKGNKPPVIADRIEVVELEMGTQPPELEIRDIGELTMDQFRGIFRLTYAGDAHIVLRTKVQANPLNHKQPDIHLMGGSRGMLAAKHGLVVPMLLRLSHFRLNSYVVLVVSRQKGITLVFKTDPLQNVDINSTFDSIAVIQKFIQREIEGQLRQMFREDLPGIIHRLSQQWVKAKVEAPYLAKNPVAAGPAMSRSRSLDAASTLDPGSYRIPRMPAVGLSPTLASLPRRPSSFAFIPRPRSPSARSVSGVGRRPASSLLSSPVSRVASQNVTHPPVQDGPTSFPEIENYDPTYGMRPEGIPNKSTFGGLRNLFGPSKGLADLAEEGSEIDGWADDMASPDPSIWEDFLSDGGNVGPSVSEAGDVPEYETVPAVGGGTITRPRVYHSQSQIHVQSPNGDVDDEPHTFRRHPASQPTSPSGMRSPSRPTSLYNPYFARMSTLYESDFDVHPYSKPSYAAESSAEPLRRVQSIPPVPSLDHSPFVRPSSPASLQTQPSRSSDMTHSVPTPPPPEDEQNLNLGVRIGRPRRLSATSSNLDTFSASSYEQHHHPHPEPKIVLRPTLNGSISKLSTLSHSNHTLSPYTRTVEHFTVRSVPPRDAGMAGPASAVERQPVKARRKRLHRLGKKPAKPPEAVGFNGSGEGGAFDESEGSVDLPSSPGSPAPPSEFDASEMDVYFRKRDDLIPRYPNLHPSHVRRRVAHPL
uniref:Mitochondrial distribution and morphology protein 34 n=1 Tax=Ganoderma boninense TaxID=34458 RepID=A0A5K1K4W2_9APHY|nr:Peptidyl-prolyl cis-trans isomerase (PPIase) (EC [Ganoderma boninense]